LGLRRGQRVLEISAGTGTNLPLMHEVMGSGEIIGLDISRAMLLQCRRKMAVLGLPAQLVESDAGHVPFKNESFDAVFHHGGLAEFGDRARAISEMMRVARSGARIVICDVGVPRDRRLSLVNRLLLRAQPEYAKHPPDDIMPADAGGVRLSWFAGGGWYMVECTKR
jgi:ubiquinone/menaquinone biosynthesis C-methylase UbiE